MVIDSLLFYLLFTVIEYINIIRKFENKGTYCYNYIGKFNIINTLSFGLCFNILLLKIQHLPDKYTFSCLLLYAYIDMPFISNLSNIL
jgi:hypothetical protein